MIFTTLVTVAALVTGALPQATFQINTPTAGVIQCTPTSITWTGGQGPFTLLFQTPDANGAIEQTYTGIAASPFVWATNITGPIQLGMTIRDSQGNSAQSGPFNVNSSPDSSCLAGAASSTGASSTESGSTGSAGSTVSSSSTSGSSVPTTSASTTPASTSTPLSTGSTSHPVSGSSTGSSGTSSRPTSSSPSTSSPATTSQTGAAMPTAAAAGFAGVVGLVVAGLMA